MKKGIAVDTVILIILGVVVLGLVGYLLYIKFGQITPQGTLNDCRTQVITNYCPKAIAGQWFKSTGDWSVNKFGDGDNNPECASFANQLGMTSCKSSAEACGVVPASGCT